MSQQALQRAIDLVPGGQSGLARCIGVKQGHVWYWLNRRSGQAPADVCRLIEAATGGRVTRYELRPDVFGPAPGNAQEPAAPGSSDSQAA